MSHEPATDLYRTGSQRRLGWWADRRRLGAQDRAALLAGVVHPTVALLSFRLGVADGVSVAAGQWAAALRQLGCSVYTVAGHGDVDRRITWLAHDSTARPQPTQLADALGDADVVVVENLCSLPMNPPATAAVVQTLRSRPAILRHHDLPWERQRYADVTGWPPDDPAWVHVAISDHSRRQLLRRGLRAITLYHGYADLPEPGRRESTRRLIGTSTTERVLLQPTRAIRRKNIAAGVRLAKRLGATYWLTGPTEEGFGSELREILGTSRSRVLRGLPDGLRMTDAYAAADAVVLPSTWEGFGMPLIESALAERPLAVGNYPVALEVARFGFRWFPVDDPEPLRRFLADPDNTLLAANRRLAVRHFGPAALRARLQDSLSRFGLPTEATG
jgi:glycosyltransferase involved in cell wall biosynthesis